MNIAQIEENVKSLLVDFSSGKVEQDDFIYKLLLAYGHRKQSVTRLRSGERNMASKSNEPHHDEVIWKRQLYYKHVEGNDLHAEIDQMRKEKLVTANKLRFVIVTNFDQLLAVDTKTSDSLDIELADLTKQFDFFLPWAGMEKAVYQGENPADVKAAEKMAKLFDLIKGDNFDESNRDDTEALHNLNVFLTRLLFCFFAEDTEIFTNNQFSAAIKSHTKDDGSDLPDYLNRLFLVLNTADVDRGELPDYLANFPYVNGGLFADDIPSPVFFAKSRRMLIECGSELDWSDINPDIFGSMIQAVVHPDQRGGMGMHYTSVTNIMKVIEPLFLNGLYEELEKVESSTTKLQKLQQRLGEIKLFDPACGSGNFLIIAYKELRKLEMEVLKRLQELELEKTGQISHPFSVIKLSQFYGIELDDFAHEVAILSLWLAEHQRNVEFKAEFGDVSPSLPLKKSGSIICGNAVGESWEKVCPTSGDDEVYLLGNPPYVGGTLQSRKQKSDIDSVFKSDKDLRNLDYVSCWVVLAGRYILRRNARFAFVTTNSICQGEQVSYVWNEIFGLGLEIGFAHQSFKWTNNAKGNAGVVCIVVGVRNPSDEKKLIFDGMLVRSVENINGYLASSANIIVEKCNKSISGFPKIVLGNQPRDDGQLLLSKFEKDELLASYPSASPLIKKLFGAREFLQGHERWCLWIEDKDLKLARSIPTISDRIDSVYEFRCSSRAKTTRGYSNVPHKFAQISRKDNSKGVIIIPKVSSVNRDYIPIGFLGEDCIVTDAAQTIPEPSLYIFSILNSRMHMAWVRAVAGRFKTDYRYSIALCYNPFPFPKLNNQKIKELESLGMGVLTAREEYSSLTMNKLYSLEAMPESLRMAHERLDQYVDSLYSNSYFVGDEERLSILFSMYQEMTGDQSA